MSQTEPGRPGEHSVCAQPVSEPSRDHAALALFEAYCRQGAPDYHAVPSGTGS